MTDILFFADAASVHTRRWVAAMAERGFDCSVVSRAQAAVPGARRVLTLAPADGVPGLAGWFTALPAVRRLARQLRPRWLHGHYVTSYGLWAAEARAAWPAPLVLTAWGSDILVTPRQRGLRGALMRRLLGRTLRRADLITADAQDVLQAIAAYRPAAALHEVLWGADTDRFLPGAPAPGFEIASLRAWEPNYRIDVLLRAFARLHAQRPAAVLHLLGGGPQEAALRALARALALDAAAVRFTGRVDDAGLRATLQRCRASASVPASDATSVSLLEAMACGLPVVASDLPANRRWLPPELLVPVDDADALAAVWLRLHDDPARAQALGAQARARVAAEGARRLHMDRMAALLRALPSAAAGPVEVRP
jgi:glycosyltransferase involved in cell wall biosynthesis